ncbi:MAG: hypothetical protein ACOZF0_15275 [Thermodesulfobacteriota bacterium]
MAYLVKLALDATPPDQMTPELLDFSHGISLEFDKAIHFEMLEKDYPQMMQINTDENRNNKLRESSKPADSNHFVEVSK